MNREWGRGGEAGSGSDAGETPANRAHPSLFEGQATNGSGFNTSRAVARIGSPAIGGGRRRPRTSGAEGQFCERDFSRLPLFLTALPSSCSPRTGYIQRRFSASSVWYVRFPAFSVRQGTAACRDHPCACVEKFEPLRGSSGKLFFFSITAFHFFAFSAFFAA